MRAGPSQTNWKADGHRHSRIGGRSRRTSRPVPPSALTHNYTLGKATARVCLELSGMPNTQSSMFNPLLSPRSHAWPKEWDTGEERKVDIEALKAAAATARNAGTAFASANRVSLAVYNPQAAAICAQRYIARGEGSQSVEARMEALNRAERMISTPAAGRRVDRPLSACPRFESVTASPNPF